METFHMSVLAIAAAVLILILTSVGVMIRNSNRDTTWPPAQSSCPDGWEPDITVLGKCYIPSSMRNSGNVAMSPVSATNTTAGYNLDTEDKWHLCGTADYVSADRLTLYADSKSNFNYFNIGNSIRLYGKFGQFTYVDRLVASKTEKSLTLTSALAVDPKSPIAYHGKRMSVTFGNTTLTNTTVNGTTVGTPTYGTICNKKSWAKSNSVEWDGVSNYNKCPAT